MWCTFRKTQENHEKQEMIVCRTCWPDDGSSCICLACANYCHFGHELSAIKSIVGFCDCGAEQKCCNRNPFAKDMKQQNTTKIGDIPPNPKTAGNEYDSKQMHSSLVHFANGLLAYTAINPNSNSSPISFIASPFNIWNAMSIVYLASSHDAKTAMEKTGIWTSKETNLSQLQHLQTVISTMPQIKAGYWVLHKGPVKNTFKNTLGGFAQCMPLTDVKQVNDLVSVQTNQLIPNLLAPTDIDANTTHVILSTLYFKGQWKQQFDPHLTKSKPFFGRLSQRKELLMTQKEVKHRYLETKTHQWYFFPTKKKERIFAWITPILFRLLCFVFFFVLWNSGSK